MIHTGVCWGLDEVNFRNKHTPVIKICLLLHDTPAYIASPLTGMYVVHRVTRIGAIQTCTLAAELMQGVFQIWWLSDNSQWWQRQEELCQLKDHGSESSEPTISFQTFPFKKSMLLLHKGKVKAVFRCHQLWTATWSWLQPFSLKHCIRTPLLPPLNNPYLFAQHSAWTVRTWSAFHIWPPIQGIFSWFLYCLPRLEASTWLYTLSTPWRASPTPRKGGASSL